MSIDKELEDILASLEQTKKDIENIQNAPSEQFVKKVKEAPTEPITPPEPILSPEPVANEIVEQKDEPKKKSRKKLTLPAPNNINKKALIIAIAIIAIIGVIFGIYQASYGYIKTYEKKYSVEYPNGIQREFCKDYGKDNTVRGKITIADLEMSQLVSTYQSNINPVLERGSKVEEEQQFRSISLSNYKCDLESIYSTPEGFLNASQGISFDTIFEDAKYQVVASYYTNSSATNGDEYVFPYQLFGNMTQKSFVEFEDKIKSRRLYDTGYEFNYYDEFLSISSDSDFMDGYKFVVLCVKVKSVKKSTTATPNEKIHYPQSYYDAKNEHNPYQYAPQWYPEIIIDGENYRLTSDNFV